MDIMDDLKKIQEKIKKIELTPEEKKEMRDNIIAVLKSRPNPRENEGGENTFPVKSPYVFKFKKALAFAAIILVIAGGMSVSLAAENALPGDLLYSVKIKVNEGLSGLMARSDEAQVRWLVKTAERRIEEAEKMAASGKLDVNSANNIEDNLESKTKRLKDKLNSLDDKESLGIGADVVSKLENSLSAHEEVIKKLSLDKGEAKKDLDSILSDVKSVAESVRESRKNFDRNAFKNKDNKFMAAQVRLKLAQDSIKDAEKALQDSGKADDETKKKAAESISRAKEVILEAEAKLRDSADSDTLEKLHRAVGLSNEARVMLDANVNLNITGLNFSSNATNTENATSSNDENKGEGNQDSDNNGGDNEGEGN
ncbi:hypothetical protein HYT00_00970 [Candidatus Giovannonibacteria bacterium]|nr:hypothetical protein [Candidatus Giovannonibacteria bacterium]